MSADGVEDVELAEDRRRYIDDAFARLDQLSYYALFGLSPAAEQRAAAEKLAHSHQQKVPHLEALGILDDLVKNKVVALR